MQASHRVLSHSLCITLLASITILAATAGAATTPAWSNVQSENTRRLSRSELEDKIRGGWAGQMIGVSYGAPTEFASPGKIITENLGHYQDWSSARLKNTIEQDDLYVEMTFAEVMDEIGLNATTEQYGQMFRDSKYNLWHANAGARRLLNHGISAPLSGDPRYNIHANDIDFQIESDFIGLMTPGLPREANKYADRVGRVMNWGDGLYGGMFFAGMYAAAFFEKDPRKVVEKGLQSIPPDSQYARLIRDVLRWSAEYPDDWTVTWQQIEEKWNRNDSCPELALRRINIDAKLNGGYVALGLLYGRGDFDKTLEVSTRSGQDSDCNPSSAAGILGVMLGYGRIPEKWKSGIPAIADTRFAFTKYSLNDIVVSTVSRALKVVQQVGGRVTAEYIEVPPQTPQAPALEQWSMGVARERVAFDDPAWRFSVEFSAQEYKYYGQPMPVESADTAGAQAVFTFTGTGVAIMGVNSQDGGRADVWLDGARAGEIDAWVPSDTYDLNYWHVAGLAPGKHTVKIITTGDADARSTGTQVELLPAVVYD